MRPKLQKRSVLKLAGRIILGAKRRGKTNVAWFANYPIADGNWELSPKRSVVG